MIYGPAGGGKTAITLYRTSVLARRGKRCKVFVYTRVLNRFIRIATDELRLPPDIVQSLYSWAAHLHRQHIGPPPSRAYATWIDNLIDFYECNRPAEPLYDYVLVDEAQDFEANVPKLLALVARHLFVAGDTAQSLYTDIIGLDTLMDLWSPLDRHAFFFHNYRNPRNIAAFAAEFLDTGSWAKSQFLHNVAKEDAGRKPMWYETSSEEEQDRTIAHVVAEARGAQRIGILCLRRNDVLRCASRLGREGVSTQVVFDHQQCDFDDAGRPVITTIHSAKGLEFDWVILPNLSASSWVASGNWTEDRLQRLLFVAATRAKERLYLISPRGQECSFFRTLPPNLIQSATLPRQSSVPTIESREPEFADLPF